MKGKDDDATGWHEIPLNMGRHTVGWLGRWEMMGHGKWVAPGRRRPRLNGHWIGAVLFQEIIIIIIVGHITIYSCATAKIRGNMSALCPPTDDDFRSSHINCRCVVGAWDTIVIRLKRYMDCGWAPAGWLAGWEDEENARGCVAVARWAKQRMTDGWMDGRTGWTSYRAMSLSSLLTFNRFSMSVYSLAWPEPQKPTTTFRSFRINIMVRVKGDWPNGPTDRPPSEPWKALPSCSPPALHKWMWFPEAKVSGYYLFGKEKKSFKGVPFTRVEGRIYLRSTVDIKNMSLARYWWGKYQQGGRSVWVGECASRWDVEISSCTRALETKVRRDT